MSAGIYISTLFLLFLSQKKTPVSICHLLFKVSSFILKYSVKRQMKGLHYKVEKTEATPNSSELKKKEAWMDFFFFSFSKTALMLMSYKSDN